MQSNQATQKALSKSESSSIKGMINRTLIVEWGTIKEVLGGGSVVEVLLAVTDKPENATAVTCVLLSPCSKSFSINIMPKVGDKVLVLSPRYYDADMFDVSSGDSDDTEVIIDEQCHGYNKLTCLAILYNQFRDNYKTFIDVSDDGLKLVTENKMQIEVKSDNKIVFTEGNKSNELTIDLSGDNPVYSDSNGMEIESTSEATVINGNLKIKTGSAV